MEAFHRQAMAVAPRLMRHYAHVSISAEVWRRKAEQLMREVEMLRLENARRVEWEAVKRARDEVLCII